MKPASVIVVLCLVITAFARPEQQKTASAHHETQTANQPAPKPTVADESPDGNPQPRTTQDVAVKEQHDWGITEKIAIYALVIGLFQFGALVATIVVMIRTARRQLRAYVAVERGIIANVADPPTPKGEKIETVARILHPDAGPTIQITIKNSGQTPAYDLVHWATARLDKFPLETELASMPDPRSKYRNVVGPGIPEVKTIRLPKPLELPEKIGLREGSLAIYCWGEIVYRDAFGKRRYTRYRCMYGYMCGIIGVATDMVYCEEGNEAD